MARCNIFKPLQTHSGEFLMFSSFPEAVTKEMSEGPLYRVVPSKFACLEIDTSGLKGIDNFKIPTKDEEIRDDYNVALPAVFQDYYENALALEKERQKEKFDPSIASTLLWNTLERFGMIHNEPIDEKISSYKEIKYIGDIPFYNNKTQDDMNYTEIYCHVPVSAERTLYYTRPTKEELTIHELQKEIKKNEDNEDVEVYKRYIEGWTNLNYPVNNSISHYPLGLVKTQNEETGEYIYKPLSVDRYDSNEGLGYMLYANIPYEINPDPAVTETSRPYFIDPLTEKKPEEFQFNCILVFFDTYQVEDPSDPTAEPKKINSNIPLGVYFPGIIEKNGTSDNKLFTNIVTKYVSNVDAFGQGSSYGLRIMTRASAVPNSTTYQITVDEDQDTASLSTMMGEMGDLIKEMRDSKDCCNELSQDLKDHLAMFKNYRVNVPYIREVSGLQTWFVNGRNTGVPATGAQGAQGFIGLQGYQGYVGNTGARGEIGPQGIQGYQGYQGIQGYLGLQGVQGIQGVQGYQGVQGVNPVNNIIVRIFANGEGSIVARVNDRDSFETIEQNTHKDIYITREDSVSIKATANDGRRVINCVITDLTEDSSDTNREVTDVNDIKYDMTLKTIVSSKTITVNFEQFEEPEKPNIEITTEPQEGGDVNITTNITTNIK